MVLILLLLKHLGNTKINKLDTLDIVLFLQQDILRLQIPMTDIMLVQVGNGRENLPHNNSSLGLCQKLLFNNQIEQLTTLTYLCYQIDGFFSLVDFVEFDDVGMVEDFEDLDLRGEDLLVDDVLF